MGLFIDVGFHEGEDDSSSVEGENSILNKVLLKNGLPAHTVPETLHAQIRSEIHSFPYSYLHYLRRFYARLCDDPEWCPTPASDPPMDDPYVEEESMMMNSHLLCHSDSEGYYVPVEFEDIIFDDSLPGEMLGSSHRLREELIEVAPKLGITINQNVLSDAEAARLNQLVAAEQEDVFFRECCVWLALFEACRVSIECGTLICFR